MSNLSKKEVAKRLFIEKLFSLGYVRALPKKGYEQSSLILSNCECYFSSHEMYFSPREYGKIDYALDIV